MSRNYSPKTFLRKTPNALLKEYFAAKGVLGEIDFDKLGETQVDPVIAAMEALAVRDRTQIEQEFRQINELACEQGVRVLLEEGQSPYHELDLAETFGSMGSHYERAFWMFLNHRKVFDIAADLAYMDRVSSWRSREVGVGLTPAVEKKDLEALAAGVSEFYRKEGRGHHCVVDNYLREDPQRHCYFAYPEDYATIDMELNDEEEFVKRPRKPAFEVIFVYRPQTGILETSARGRKDQIDKLLGIFCRVILGLAHSRTIRSIRLPGSTLKGGGSSLADLLAKLAARLSVPDGDIVTGDEVRKWPAGKLQKLVAERILQEIDPGTTVVCDQCDQQCSIEPQRRTDPRTGKVVGVHLCMREEGGGRIEIDLNRLRRWKINKRKLAQMGYRQGEPGSPGRQNRQVKRTTEKTQLIAALLAHHRFSDDVSAAELDMTPATQEGLAKKLKWEQSKVSRVLKRCFPAGFWSLYKRACQSDALRGVLAKLDEDVTTIEPVHYQPHHPTPREEQQADYYR